MKKLLYREHYAINGTITDADLMLHPETKELVFCTYFGSHGYENLEFDSLTDIIVFLNAKHNRTHFLTSDNEIHYLDEQTIYSQYYASIKEC